MNTGRNEHRNKHRVCKRKTTVGMVLKVLVPSHSFLFEPYIRPILWIKKPRLTEFKLIVQSFHLGRDRAREQIQIQVTQKSSLIITLSLMTCLAQLNPIFPVCG